MKQIRAFLLSMACALCLSSAWGETLFLGLETGMSQTQVQDALGKSDKVILPGKATSVFGAETVERSYFTTKGNYCGFTWKITPLFDDKGLKFVLLESLDVFDGAQFDGALRSQYKHAVVLLGKLFKNIAPVAKWPEQDIVEDGKVFCCHRAKSATQEVAAGIVNHEGTFSLTIRFGSQEGVPDNSKDPKPELESYWASVPEFYNLIEADKLIVQAVDAIYAKKPQEAMKAFDLAATLGSSRGYWGMSFLYGGGMKGISSNGKLRDEYRLKAASMGYALSAVEVDKNFAAAMTKANVSPSAAKEMLETIHRAAAEGRMSEQYNLGIMYKNGYGVPKNAEKAKSYFQAAADQGDKQAEAALKGMK